MVFREQLNVDSQDSSARWTVSKRCAIILVVMFLLALLGSALLGHFLTASPSAHCEKADPGVPTKNDTTKNETQSSSVKDVRLPSHLQPLFYDVRLLPIIEVGNFTIDGSVEVQMKAVSSGDNVTIHIKDLVVKKDSVGVVDMSSGKSIGIKSLGTDEAREFFIVKLKQAVQKNRMYKLKMQFTAQLNDKLAGFYRSSYIDRNGTKKWLAITQFQPTDARRAFPCFDEPALKASFNITLGRKKSMRSASNMPIARSEPIPNMPGYEWDIFQQTVPMSTYLVAFMVSDFAMKKADPGVSKTLFRVWSRPQAIEQAEYARKIGPMILNYFEKFFKTPFPLPKQDMAAIPDFSAGAMENWGLITYRETALLYEEGISSNMDKQRVAVVVSHELAHQWFGNLVTPYWWTDLWLNEGFASYVEYLGVDKVEPTWKMMEQFITEAVQKVMTTDALETSHPISIPVQHPDEINEIFDSISYDKGASIIRMMDHYLTSETLRNGLANYLSEKKYQAATQDDLWKALTTQAHKDKSLPRNLTVKTIMDTWTLQMGYPVIHIERDYQSNTAIVSQSRFLLNKADSSDNFRWWIPITFTDQKTPDFNNTRTKIWMPVVKQMKIQQLPAKNHWLIANIQEHGYYKVSYDKKNWQMIIRQLLADHKVIHTINRAQLIDDSLDLARSGLLDYDIALSILDYLKNEQEYTPWESALNNLGYINTQLKSSPGYGAFKKFILKLIKNQYDSVGFQERSSDTLLDRYKRDSILAWACSMGHEDCVQRCRQLYSAWMQQPTNTTIIPANQRSQIYCTAIKNGGEAEWEFAWQQYGKSNVAAEKRRILRALGCSKEVWLLSRYLSWLLPAQPAQSKIRIQDGTYVFSTVARNTVGRTLAFDFLRNNWSEMVKRYSGGVFQLPRFVAILKRGYNTQLDIEQLQQFQKKHHKDLAEARREMSQAIEYATTNQAWMEKNYNAIVDWLEKHS